MSKELMFASTVSFPPVLIYRFDCAPSYYTELRSGAPCDWIIIIPYTPRLKKLLEEAMPGPPELLPGTALRTLDLPFVFIKNLDCHRISKPGKLFTHDGQFLASEALVFFGDTVK